MTPEFYRFSWVEERGEEELKNLCKEVSHLGPRPEETVKLTNRTPLSFPACPLKREAGWQLRPFTALYDSGGNIFIDEREISAKVMVH